MPLVRITPLNVNAAHAAQPVIGSCDGSRAFRSRKKETGPKPGLCAVASKRSDSYFLIRPNMYGTPASGVNVYGLVAVTSCHGPRMLVAA